MKVKISECWTPEQANAVAEFLGEMEIAIRKKVSGQDHGSTIISTLL